MSRTSAVPVEVPSVLQSSPPSVPLLAAKQRTPLALPTTEGLLLPGPGLISATRTEPPLVPSLFQSSRPTIVLVAEKYRMPFWFERYNGSKAVVVSRNVPDEVP